MEGGKIVYFPGCFANYYDSQIARTFLPVMEENDIKVQISVQLCCGMPMMANGNLKGAKKNFERIVKDLHRKSEGRYDIVTTCPSCNIMLRKEGKRFFGSEEADYVSKHLYDASEYIVKLEKEGRLRRNFGRIDFSVLYHNPCHLKVQGLEDTYELLRLIPGVEIVGVNKECCGMGGSFGMKKKNYELSTTIGMKVWRMVKELKPMAVITECGGCGLQISAGTNVSVIHPMVLLFMAYKANR